MAFIRLSVLPNGSTAPSTVRPPGGVPWKIVI